jgi:Glycosyl transferase family 2
VKLVMTLLVRDEADVVDAHLAFHLNAGVDLVVATDHRSVDGTAEILESYASAGHVHLFREQTERIRQSDWVTRMARLSATEHGADWVINSDADEFWWPRFGTLKDALATVPREYGAVRALQRPFVPRPDDDGDFLERMTYRLAVDAPINDPATPYRPVVKAAHRGDPDVVVGQGNHVVSGVSRPPLEGWSPLELFHLPLRSREQVARRHRKGLSAWRSRRGDVTQGRAVADREAPEALYDRTAVDDDALRRGIAEGTLVKDLRLRDALRRVRAPSAHGHTDGGAVGATHDVIYAVERSCFVEAELVRLQRRVDGLGARVAAREVRRRSVRRTLGAGPRR